MKNIITEDNIALTDIEIATFKLTPAQQFVLNELSESKPKDYQLSTAVFNLINKGMVYVDEKGWRHLTDFGREVYETLENSDAYRRRSRLRRRRSR